ncbi:MAG TPA: RagB/SusD family nutrient uptake outer membrane protein [Puia sp.]|nr:RagB/SusD family nutrient uptake outer membrane protein [Puia sp.]
MRNVLLTTVLLTLLLSACTKNNGFLNQTVTTDLTEAAVFSDSARSMDFLAGIYANMDFSFKPTRFPNSSSLGAAGLEACSDEAEGPASSTVTTYNQFVLGSVGPYSITPDAWNTSYSNIRAVNQWLKHLPSIPISNSLKNRTKGEALFLRAWYYFIMLKHYGGVPLVGDTVYSVTDDISSKRNTYEECVDYVTSQCDAAVQLVPISYTGLDFGRITKGACLALKARMLLYAASPLFNGGNTTATGAVQSIVGYPTYDANRWQLAADAAQMVINTALYSLVQDNTTRPGYGFYSLFQNRKNSEYILERMYPRNGDLENLWRPPSRGGSSTAGSFPYQNLVDAFEMSNGKAIDDPTSGYDPQNPYANRDPRLDYTVSHNGSMIYKAFETIEPMYTYDGEPNGDGFGVGSPTGMYVNKMCNDNVVPNWLFSDADRCFPLIRYADVLLMFAEATNEAAGATADVYNAVEAVRQRAGLDPYQLPAGLSKEDMRKAIQHERQIEFAFEESRFWDVRRWMIASTTDNRMMTGMRVTKDAGGNFTYTIANVRTHSFRDALYLWPIPQSEAGKSPDMLQNPGY